LPEQLQKSLWFTYKFSSADKEVQNLMQNDMAVCCKQVWQSIYFAHKKRKRGKTPLLSPIIFFLAPFLL